MVSCFPSYQAAVSPLSPLPVKVRAFGRRMMTFRVERLSVFAPPGPTRSRRSSTVYAKVCSAVMLLLISLSSASPFALAASGVRVSGARLQPAAITAAAARNASVCFGINIDFSCLSLTAARRADHEISYDQRVS